MSNPSGDPNGVIVGVQQRSMRDRLELIVRKSSNVSIRVFSARHRGLLDQLGNPSVAVLKDVPAVADQHRLDGSMIE